MNVLGFAFAVGFLLSIPVGPVSSLVIRQALRRGFGAGLAAGAGVALADALFGALGIVGATLPIVVALASGPARVAAGLVLVALGFALVRSRADDGRRAAASVRDKVAGFAGTFLIAIVNPGAVPIVAAAFAAAHVPAMPAGTYPIAFAALFAGALLWWAILAGCVVRFRARMNATALRALNLGTGAIAVAAGIGTIVATLAR